MNKADFVGAIRLPSDAFKREGTAVVTDIVFLRKRDRGDPAHHVDPDWLGIAPLEIDGAEVSVNRYFLSHPEMVLGEETPGVKFVYIGDTGRTDNLRPYVQDAHTLVIESTFLDGETEQARAFGHITAREAATLAAECNVQSLILNHVSRRYRERDIVDEARRTFPNAYIARDFDHFVMRRGKPVEKLTPEAKGASGVYAEAEGKAEDD